MLLLVLLLLLLLLLLGWCVLYCRTVVFSQSQWSCLVVAGNSTRCSSNTHVPALLATHLYIKYIHFTHALFPLSDVTSARCFAHGRRLQLVGCSPLPPRGSDLVHHSGVVTGCALDDAGV
jgi:hypothetical protein